MTIALAQAPMLLGMDWMDPNWLLDQFGGAFYWISLLIVFIECGLFFPFLPGDTLLFALGLFLNSGRIDIFGTPPLVELVIAFVLLTGAAFRHLGLAEPTRDPSQFVLFGDAEDE